MQIVLDKIAKNGKKDNKLILKSEHKFKSKKNNAFNEEFNQIALIANDDKYNQSIQQKHMHTERAKIQHVKEINQT